MLPVLLKDIGDVCSTFWPMQTLKKVLMAAGESSCGIHYLSFGFGFLGSLVFTESKHDSVDELFLAGMAD